MTKPLPIKLPPGFDWIETIEDGGGARSVALNLFDRSVLRIVPRRAGWLVVIDLKDPQLPQADVAVHSIAAGMRWAARWVQGRVKRLHAMTATSAKAPPPCNSTWAALSADGRAREPSAREGSVTPLRFPGSS